MSWIFKRRQQKQIHNPPGSTSSKPHSIRTVQPLWGILSKVGGLIPLAYFQPVSNSVGQTSDLTHAINDDRRWWCEVWQAMAVIFTSALLAISELLSNSHRWRKITRESANRPETHDVLVRLQAELEDIRSNHTPETVHGMRTKLKKMQQSINSVVQCQVSKDVAKETTNASQVPSKNANVRQPFRAVISNIIGSAVTPLRSRLSFRPPGLPTIPEHVFGRDEMVEKVVGNVIESLGKESPQHTALTGTVGTGKSTIARVAVNHATIARAFGRARHWVPCQTLPTVEGLLNGLADSLSLEKRTARPLDDILSYLYDNPSSLFIVFDDFSKPENDIELRQLEDALERLNQTARVHMLLTSRDLPLPGNVGWLHLLVQPLSLDAAIDTYKAISPHHEDEIEDLVRTLDCNPFAIIVMARQGERPAEQLKTLRSTGRLGRSPVDNAIQMSLSSRRFESVPEALTLLAILAKLPKGAHYKNLAEIAPGIQNHWKALATLLESSLAAREADGYVQVQGPTRNYLARNHVLEQHHMHALGTYYFRICEDCWQELGTKEFECAAKVLTVEGANARALLLEALRSDPSTTAIRAAIGYANFLYHDIPGTDVIVKAIEVVEDKPLLDPQLVLLPFSYFLHGKLLFRLDKYIAAKQAFEKAEEMWSASNNYAELGWVHYFFGQINRLLGKEPDASKSYIRAREYFERVHNSAGICETLRGLAVISAFYDNDTAKAVQVLETAKQHGKGHEPSMASVFYALAWVSRAKNAHYAVELLRDAHEAYTRYGARYQAALCTYQMGIAQYESGCYDEARDSLLRSYQEFDALDTYTQMGYTLHHLVELEVRRGDFVEALRLNSEARTIFNKIQVYMEVARGFVCRGRVLAKMRQYINARAAYDEGRAVIMQHKCSAKLLRVIDQEVQNLFRLQQSN